ncbi:gamma carbonic anhydrase family protein [Homoserinibacter sp. YIM 151385]|uniref:gamma carbonic anhydrase family protein n=1 Tax=Homoserinibacter sp. YIM 151385 TaxID=2985506 RepID=UPI0022F0E533|nr:gamma carbonic anhydrase family protein [Homoserinibacter sp. YIM 151385]WBU39186.1 gamma carbonic anhydrase family protein [Homoserinibacter sp. YIM 151385]
MATILPYGDDHPEIHEEAWAAPTATLIGRVRLHPRSSVFYGAVLRADRDAIEIGEGSNLQDNVVAHGDPGVPTVVGRGVSVGHGAILHGTTVEDDCLIGMGATLLNRSVIGRESLVAAGALVLEDAVIPPRSLVAGVPAKVRRELTEEEVDGIRRNAATYLELAAAHRALA